MKIENRQKTESDEKFEGQPKLTISETRRIKMRQIQNRRQRKKKLKTKHLKTQPKVTIFERRRIKMRQIENRKTSRELQMSQLIVR